MCTQTLGIALVAAGSGFALRAVAAVLTGAGAAMAYPALLAVIGDVAHPTWRARAVGVYRLWRDAGYAIGALLAGITADLFGLRTAVWAIALITALSGLVVAARMYATRRPHPPVDTQPPMPFRRRDAHPSRPMGGPIYLDYNANTTPTDPAWSRRCCPTGAAPAEPPRSSPPAPRPD
jgi:MFS family permease